MPDPGGQMLWPTPGHSQVSSVFADWPPWRKEMGLSPHSGIDIRAPQGAPIRAPISGLLTFSETDWGGLTLSIYGEKKWDTENPALAAIGQTFYFIQLLHLSLLLGVERDVRIGEAIGAVGSTGTASTGPHLHLTLQTFHRGGWIFTDPALFWDTVPLGRHAFLDLDRQPLYA